MKIWYFKMNSSQKFFWKSKIDKNEVFEVNRGLRFIVDGATIFKWGTIILWSNMILSLYTSATWPSQISCKTYFQHLSQCMAMVRVEINSKATLEISFCPVQIFKGQVQRYFVKIEAIGEKNQILHQKLRTGFFNIVN